MSVKWLHFVCIFSLRMYWCMCLWLGGSIERIRYLPSLFRGKSADRINSNSKMLCKALYMDNENVKATTLLLQCVLQIHLAWTIIIAHLIGDDASAATV